MALFPLWFLAIAGVANGIGHPLLALAAGGYFPGLATSALMAAAGGLLLVRLTGVTASAAVCDGPRAQRDERLTCTCR